MRGGNDDSARDALRRELAARIAAVGRTTEVGETDVLMLVELAKGGVVVWTIDRDSAGIPRCYFEQPKSWVDLENDNAIDVAALRQFALPPDGASVMLVCTSPAGPLANQAYQTLSSDPQILSAYQCSDSLEKMLIEVLSHDRLTLFYRLVLIQVSSSGRAELTSCRLFDPGAKRGDTCQVEFWCESGGNWGTTFAVVADGPDRPFQLVSVKSANLAPGSYTVTAELRGPGLVRFNGVQAGFRCDDRSWYEIVASVPERIQVTPVAHLICLVEVNGSKEEVDRRLEWVEQLIHELPGGLVSLLTYGPHEIRRLLPGGEPEELAWALPASVALEQVRKLRDRSAAPAGYTKASQLECVLRAVADRLGRVGDQAQRHSQLPVLVTVGVRPAYPPRRDAATDIIPCRRSDWREELRRLGEHPGVRFGAIMDRRVDDEIWTQLGHDAQVWGDSPGNTFDVRSFAVDLGLVSAAADSVPLPLLQTAGG